VIGGRKGKLRPTGIPFFFFFGRRGSRNLDSCWRDIPEVNSSCGREKRKQIAGFSAPPPSVHPASAMGGKRINRWLSTPQGGRSHSPGWRRTLRKGGRIGDATKAFAEKGEQKLLDQGARASAKLLERGSNNFFDVETQWPAAPLFGAAY